MAYGEGGSRGRGGYGGGGGSFGGGRSFAPVKVGEEIDVKIEAVGEKGDGIAKVKGFVLFVPGVKEGQECRIKITRVLKKVGFADKVGDALGPVVSESSGKSEETASEDSGADVVEAEAEESPKDSEDFGDESGDAEEDTSEQFADDEEQA